MKIRKGSILAIAGGIFGILLIIKGHAGSEPPPPPPPDPEDPQAPPFGLELASLGYTGSVSISRVQWSDTTPRYGVRVRHTTGGKLNLICFLVQPGGKLETFRAYTNLASGDLKEFTFSANLTVPEQVGTWTAYLYGSPDATLSTSHYIGVTASEIAQAARDIP